MGDPILRIHSASGQLIAEDDDSGLGNESRIAFTAGQSGTYYLSATGLQGGVGTYTLSTAISGATDHDDATTYFLPSFGSVSSAINFAGDSDTYRLDLASNQYYQWNLNSTSNLDPILSLVDSFGNIVASNDDTNGVNSQIQFITATSGTYYLRASGFAQSVGSYSLSTSLLGTIYTGTPFGDMREGRLRTH